MPRRRPADDLVHRRLGRGAVEAGALLLAAILLLATTPAAAPPDAVDLAMSRTGARGASSGVASLPEAPRSGRPLDPAAVRAFMDDTVPAQLDTYRIPGAAVVVVSGGRQVLAQGYGMADLGAGRPVEASRTVFPIDSVAKVLTATAVMQLVEDGRLDLHADVNRYLDGFSIPDTYPGRPITLTHLLAHTAGFEEQVIGILPPGDIQPLATYLADTQPARVRPPGELAAYSNYGLALAGLIVEQRSGVPFERYVQDRILRPLGMVHTTFEHPPPAPVAERLAKLYQPQGDGQTELFRAGDPLTPAGGAVATVTDMGRFMLAHLGGGRLGDTRMLSAPAIRTMHERQFGHDPRLPGRAIAFHEWYRAGVRMLSHGGDGPGSHSMLALLPEQGDGIYVVFNGDGLNGGAIAAAHDVVEGFVDHFHPGGDLPDGPTRGGAAASGVDDALGRFTGTYRSARVSHTDFTVLITAMADDVTVTAEDDGTLTTTGLSQRPGVTEQRWEPVGPLLFRERGGRALIAFAEHDGHVTALFDGINAYEHLRWYQAPQLHLVIAATGLVLLLSCAVWPLRALWGRIRGNRRGPLPRGARVARLLAVATATLVLAFPAAVLALASDLETAALAGAPLLQVVFVPLQVAAATALAVVVCAVLAWWRGWWGPGARVHFTAVALGAVLLFGVAHVYHFIVAPLG